MSLSRIVITADLLRPHTADETRSESVTRTLWLQDLLTPPLQAATGLPVERVTSDGRPLEFDRLYADGGLEPSNDAWARLYNGELGPALDRRIVDACRDALVIGIEMPPSMSRALSRAGVPVLDCVVHPLRFLDDIPLAWRTTVDGIREALAPFGVADYDIQRRAAQIRAKVRWLGGPAIEPGTMLVLGQLPTDAAMIDPARGRRVGWSDYLDELTALRRSGPVLWRPHPYDPEAGVLADLLGEGTRTTENFYRLLALDDLAGVAAISSGGVVEARAFGKRGVHFLDRTAGIELPGWGTPVPVVGHWLSPHFWSAVLAPILPTRCDVPVLPVERDFFRRANNTDWDFGWIDQVVERRTADERRLEASAAAIAELTRQINDLTHRLTVRADQNALTVDRLMNAERHRIRAVIDPLVAAARGGGWRVGILGAGSHTEWLLAETALGTLSPLFLFDRNAAAQGRRVAGLPVHGADTIPGMNLQAVVVSSVAFQDDMVSYLQALAYDGEIVRCYP